MPMVALLLAGILLTGVALAAEAHTVLAEAEAFKDLGGWVLDQQFMDQMGSPYLLAHGLGDPVKDATTTVKFPATGQYRVFVRTNDWVAKFKAQGAPGRFQVLLDGKPLAKEFGTEGAEWQWQDGGTVEIAKTEVALALHDLTGFDGRCDAILFCSDPQFVPPNTLMEMAEFRRKCLGLPGKPEDAGDFDLVVVGGGIAGVCASVGAARLGLKVALVQDRPVLGGNNSSEVRVWLGGEVCKPPYPNVGAIVKELEPKRRAHPGTADMYEDDKRIAFVQSEPNVKLFLNTRVNSAETEGGRIKAVIGQDVVTSRRLRFAAKWFSDCTGDGAVGFLAGAEYEETKQGHMGPSNCWTVEDTGKPVAFPRCPWAVDLTDKPFPQKLDQLGKWFWESGFNRDPITEVERMRDTNLRGMFGAWDCLKNSKKLYPNHKLMWSAYVCGKRESRRLMGDHVLSKPDLKNSVVYPDGCVPTGWSIDLHLADPKYVKGFEEDPFLSYVSTHFEEYKRPYWVPYRCLYSRNIPNLFMAGRDISVTHDALGTVRVMRTCGMMGEIVSMAASLCKQHNTDPRGVYEKYLEELKKLMEKGVGKAKPAPKT
jgi:hypothetical protein